MGFDACYKITRGIENDITCSITFFRECKIQKLSDLQKSQKPQYIWKDIFSCCMT